uniref:3',5'-cyclic-GMP phosphodiesterase n=1 Tax=Mastacembelus armatus TaxID=205130 RepID=A0A7N8WKQ4_9TELE
ANSACPKGDQILKRATGPRSPHKGPHKFKQRNSLQFKNKSPKRGVTGEIFNQFGDDIPGMEGLGTDITVICPWEVYSHLELNNSSVKYSLLNTFKLFL